MKLAGTVAVLAPVAILATAIPTATQDEGIKSTPDGARVLASYGAVLAKVATTAQK